MRFLKKLFWALLLLALLCGAAFYTGTHERDDLPPPAGPAAVSLLAATFCSPASSPEKCPAESLRVTSEEGAVVANVVTAVECTDRYQFPRLTDNSGLHTLILEPQPRPWKRVLFGLLGTDCTKSMTFKINGLKPGETLFVTNSGRVVGYGAIEPTR